MEGLKIVFWYWWSAALVMTTIELLVPGFYFLGMASAGFITGCLLFLMPSISFDIQLGIFSIMSMLIIFTWRRFARSQLLLKESSHPLLNKRGAQYIGRVFDLYAPIINGQGTVKVDDSTWKVHGEDCGIGAKVKVTAIRGTIFDVEKIQ